MTIEDLIVRLRIEEDNKLAQKGTTVKASASANMVERGQSSKGKKAYNGDKKGKAKAINLGPKEGAVKKKSRAFDGNCYNCGETGHKSNRCKAPKRERAHMVDDDDMKDNQVWNLVDLPPNSKTVGSNWLFKKKTNM